MQSHKKPYAYKHICIQLKYIHTYIHKYIRTQKNLSIHTYAFINVIYTYINILYIHTYTYINTYPGINSCFPRAVVCLCIEDRKLRVLGPRLRRHGSHICSYIHTYIHRYIYISCYFIHQMWFKSFSVWLLLKMGFNVLFQDVDLVWFKNPLDLFLHVGVQPGFGMITTTTIYGTTQ